MRHRPEWDRPPPTYDAEDDDAPRLHVGDEFHYVFPPRYDGPLPHYDEATRLPSRANYEDMVGAIREALTSEMEGVYARKWAELREEFQQPVPSRYDLRALAHSFRRWLEMNSRRTAILDRRYALLSEFSAKVDWFRARIARERVLLGANPQLRADLHQQFNSLTELYNFYEERYRAQEAE